MMNEQIDFTIDKDNLYRDESVTDFKVGAIRCLTPIKTDGTDDGSRESLFFGHTQLMSPQGPVPIQARIQAATLEEAMEKFPGTMRQAMEEMVEEARRMHADQGRQQQEDSRIITPGR